MDSFLKQAAGQVSAAADKAATTAQARFGDNVAEQIKKGGQTAAGQIEHMDVNKVLQQTGLAEKAKAYGVNLPSSAPGAAPAAPAAEKAAVAAAAPGIVKDATGDMAKPPDNATPNEKAGQEQAASQAAPQLLSAALGAVGLGGKGGAAPGGGGAAGGAPPTSLAGAEEFLKAQGPGLMSAAMGALKQHGQGGAGAGGAPAGGGGGGFAAQAEGFARQAAPGLLAQLGLSGDAAKPAAGDAAKPAAGASDAK